MQTLVRVNAGLLVLAVFYTLYFGRAVLVPIVLALLLNLLLGPVVRRLARFGVPEALGAALVLIAVLASLVYGTTLLAGPAATWIERAPYSLQQIEWKLRPLRDTVEEVQKATEQVERLAEGSDASAVSVVVKGPSLTSMFLTQTSRAVASGAVVVILLYFLLASGDMFLRKLVKVLPRLRDKKRAVEIAKQIESDISTYLGVITLVNIGLGTATGIAMYLVGMPNPVLWGAMAAILNFIPYLGSITTLSILAVVGMLTFDSLAAALLPPAIFLVFTVLEGQFLTPILLGQRLTLNPVVIFVALLTWGWLWGIPGILLAVPVLAAFKILCDHIDPLAPIGEFLGRRAN